MAKDKIDSKDACPFPPDGNPPPISPFTRIENSFDLFFQGWRNYLISLIILSSIMAASLLLTPPPLIPTYSNPDTWKEQLEPSFTTPESFSWLKIGVRDISLSGQTIVSSEDSLIYESQTVQFSDLFMFQDNSKLILRNCTLIVPDYSSYRLEDIFHEYVGMLFQDNSSLEAYDSIIVTDKGRAGIGFIGKSRCILDNVIVANCSINLDEKAELYADESQIHTIYADRETFITVRDSQIGYLHHQSRWRSHWDNVLKRTAPTAEFINSSIDFAEIRVINGTQCSINVNVGNQEHWNPYTDLLTDGQTINLTLTNSEITDTLSILGIYSSFNVSNANSIWLLATNSEISCLDSQLQILSIAGNSSAKIQNSNIYQLGTSSLHTYTDDLFRRVSPNAMQQLLEISDSRVENLNIRGFSNIECDRVYVESVLLSDVEATISGTVTINDLTMNVYNPYETFALTQNYVIQAIGEERVIPRVEYQLQDSQGDAVWSGVSDENGRSEFNITYCQYYPLKESYQRITNYDETWTLTGIYSDETKTMEISMLQTDSPIIFEYSKEVSSLPVDNRVLFLSSLSLLIILTALKLWASYFNKK